MLNSTSPELRFALAAARRAADLARQVQAALVTPALTKNDKSPVTVADFAIQALVAHLLAEAFPNDVLVGEEGAADLRQPDATSTLEQVTRFVREQIASATPEAVCAWIDRGGAQTASRFWTLDPIDGTKGYLRGDQYAIALALIVEGEVQLGVLSCPNLNAAAQPEVGGAGSLAVAARGQGSYIASLATPEAFTALHVSNTKHLSASRLLRSFESGHTNANQIDDLVRAQQIAAPPVLMDSQAKYAVLAAGQGDLLFRLLSPDKPNYREKIWDQAAGAIIVEEAGGRITDLHGRALNFTQGRELKNNQGIVASNGQLHEVALAALQALGR